jgi:hypothetical protein
MNQVRNVALAFKLTGVRMATERVAAEGRFEEHDLSEEAAGRGLSGNEATEAEAVKRGLELLVRERAETF